DPRFRRYDRLRWRTAALRFDHRHLGRAFTEPLTIARDRYRGGIDSGERLPEIPRYLSPRTVNFAPGRTPCKLQVSSSWRWSKGAYMDLFSHIHDRLVGNAGDLLPRSFRGEERREYNCSEKCPQKGTTR